MLLLLGVATALASPDIVQFLTEAKGQVDWLVATRRDLHQWPELMYEEHNTSKYIRTQLDILGIDYR